MWRVRAARRTASPMSQVTLVVLLLSLQCTSRCVAILLFSLISPIIITIIAHTHTRTLIVVAELDWVVPAGRPQHYIVVQLVTLASTWCGAAIVARELYHASLRFRRR